jgi:hypothetical protein
MVRLIKWPILGLGIAVLASNLTCCSNVQFIPGDQEDTAECIQMREKLANDKTLTSSQAAEIKKHIENIGCPSRSPRP